MKILLVKPVTPKGLVLSVVPPIGLGYLVTSLRRSGLLDVSILDCIKEELNFVNFAEKIKKVKPDLIGFQIFSNNLDSLKQSLKIVKEINGRMITVAGGPHPSGFPIETLQEFTNLDFAFKGEAEIGFPQLIKKLERKNRDFKNIPGLVWRKENHVIVNPQIFPEDLNDLGFPAWDLIKPQEYPSAPQGLFFKNYPIAPIIATRGCPFLCTYCAGKTVTGPKIRARSVDNILAEIELLHRKFGIKEIHFLDDNFTFYKQNVLEFCRKLCEKDFRISWCCPNGVRLDTLDLEVLHQMKKSGCYFISVGIESGSDRILKLMKKGFTKRKIIRQINLIRKSGLSVNGFFILGYPGETKKEMEATIKFSQSLGLSKAAFFNFLPLPGTQACRQLLESDEISKDIGFNQLFRNDYFYTPKSVTRKELKKILKNAYLGFYLRPKAVVGLIKEIRTPEQLKYILKRAISFLKI